MPNLPQDVWLPGTEGETFHHGEYLIFIRRADWLGEPRLITISLTSDKYSNFRMHWAKGHDDVSVEGSLEAGENVPLIVLIEFTIAIQQERLKA